MGAEIPTKSPVFGSMGPQVPHLVQRGDIGGEVADLRSDVEKAFFDLRVPAFPRSNLPTPDAGKLVFNADDGVLSVGNGSEWLPLVSENEVVYREGESEPSGNVYATFQDAYDAALKFKAPATIVFDDRYDNPVIYPGNYDLSRINLAGIRSSCSDDNVGVYVQNGVHFVGPGYGNAFPPEVRWLNLYYYGSTPLCTLEEQSVAVALVGAQLWDENGGGFFSLQDAYLSLSLRNGARLVNDDGYVVNVDNNSLLAVFAADPLTSIGNGTINSQGFTFFLLDASVYFREEYQSLNGVIVSYAEQADKVSFDSSNVSWAGPAPTTVQEAVDALATSLGNTQGDVSTLQDQVSDINALKRPVDCVMLQGGNSGEGAPLAIDDHICFNMPMFSQGSGSLIYPDTTSTYDTTADAPSVGRIGLRGGHTYELEGVPNATDATNLQVQWYDATNGAWVGSVCYMTTGNVSGSAKAIVRPGENESLVPKYELRIKYISGTPGYIGNNNPLYSTAIVKVIG